MLGVAPWRAPPRALEGVSYGGRRSGQVALGQTQPRDPVGDPIRRDAPPTAPPPRPRCLPCAVGSVRARSAATPARVADRGAVPGRPRAPDAPPRCRTRGPEDLGAVDPAAPVEAPDGIRVGPPLHRLGPFLGHVIVRQALQGAHQLAVDDPCRERIQVPGDTVATPASSSSARPCWTSPSRMSSGARPVDGARRRVTPRTHLDDAGPTARRRAHRQRQHPLVGADDRNHACAGVSPDPPEAAPLVPTSPAPVRTQCRTAGASRRGDRAPAAATWSPACMDPAWARSQASMVTSSWPAAVGDLAKHR